MRTQQKADNLHCCHLIDLNHRKEKRQHYLKVVIKVIYTTGLISPHEFITKMIILMQLLRDLEHGCLPYM